MTLLNLIAERVHAASVSPVDITTNAIAPVVAVNNVGENVVTLISAIAGIAAVLYLLWAGIQYILSGGGIDNKESGSVNKAKLARAGIINAVIGIIITVAVLGIIRFAVVIGNYLSSRL